MSETFSISIWTIIIVIGVILVLLIDKVTRLVRNGQSLLGLRVFCRRAEFDPVGNYGEKIDALILHDEELLSLGMAASKVNQSSYRLHVPLTGARLPRTQTYPTLLLGKLTVDRNIGTITLTVGVALRTFWLMAMIPLVSSVRAFVIGRPGSAVVFIVFIILVGWLGYRMAIRQRLEDYWFLLTTKLDS